MKILVALSTGWTLSVLGGTCQDSDWTFIDDARRAALPWRAFRPVPNFAALPYRAIAFWQPAAGTRRPPIQPRIPPPVAVPVPEGVPPAVAGTGALQPHQPPTGAGAGAEAGGQGEGEGEGRGGQGEGRKGSHRPRLPVEPPNEICPDEDWWSGKLYLGGRDAGLDDLDLVVTCLPEDRLIAHKSQISNRKS